MDTVLGGLDLTRRTLQTGFKSQRLKAEKKKSFSPSLTLKKQLSQILCLKAPDSADNPREPSHVQTGSQLSRQL